MEVNKQKRKSKSLKYVYVADFETTSYNQWDRDGETKVYLYEIKSLDNIKKDVGINIDSFIDFVLNQEEEINVYFHNSSKFDGEFIISKLFSLEYERVNDIDECKKPKQFTTMTDGNRTHFLIMFIGENGHKVNIKCSYRFIPISIEELGKLVNVPKLKETHNYDEYKDYVTLADVTDEELMYLENDVEILRLSLLKIFTDLDIVGVTMAGASFNNWKKGKYMIWKNDMPKMEKTIYDEIIDLSYRGGITMVNPKYQNTIVRNFKSYDVNSLYPSQMLKEMPIGQPNYYNENELKSLENDTSHSLRLYRIYIENADIYKGKTPFIPSSTSNLYKGSYIYPRHIEDLFIALWEDELHLFETYYDCNYKIVDVLAFKKINRLFADYLEYWKNIKETTKDPVTRKIAKLMMNSLYGKFGQKTERNSKVAIGLDDYGVVEYTDVENEGNYFYRPVASYITSCARCVLIRALNSVDNKDFIYCDTDSFYTFQNVNPNIPIHDSKLGYWKFEGNYNIGKFIKTKCYIKFDENNNKICSIAGLPKDKQHLIDLDTFNVGLHLSESKLMPKLVKGGVVLVKTDFTIKLGDNDIYIL